MNCVRHKLILPAALALLVVAFTGCSREDMAVPGVAGSTPDMEWKAGGVDRDTTNRPMIIDAGVNPISDDGDDLGDKESSSRPRH